MSPAQASHRLEFFSKHRGGRRERAAEAKWLVGVGKSDVLFGFVGNHTQPVTMLPSSFDNRGRYIYKQTFVSNP